MTQIKYEHQRICKVCKRASSSVDKETGLCSKCRNAQDNAKRESAAKNKLQVNNPIGYNKHHKNPAPIVVISREDSFSALEPSEQKEQIAQLGNKIWKDSRQIRIMKSKFNMMQKVYFGFKFQEDD